MPAMHVSIPYELDNEGFEAVLVHDPSWSGPRPTVLVVHGMEGRSEAQVGFAERLLPLGYRGLAVDLFGTRVSQGGLDRCGEEMNRFMHDRGSLRRRLQQMMEVVANLDGTDADLVAAVGFCFGALCVLDLARIGAQVRGVASFHGVLTAPEQDCAQSTGDPIAAEPHRGRGDRPARLGRPLRSSRGRHSARPRANLPRRRLAAARLWQDDALVHGRRCEQPPGRHPLQRNLRSPSLARA
jgi:dienelactone hydrolase